MRVQAWAGAQLGVNVLEAGAAVCQQREHFQ
jgi:hypothetical protein